MLARNPLAFPAGFQAGFDPQHIAVAGASVRFSGRAIGGGFINILTGKPGTAVGTRTPVIDAIVGPTLKFTGSTTSYTWDNCPTNADAQLTLAVIAVFNVISSFGGLFDTSTGVSGGMYIAMSSTTALLIGVNSGINQSATITPALVANTPYFVAASNNGTTGNVVMRNLKNGKYHTGVATGITLAAPNGTMGLGGAAGLVGTASIAAAMASNAFLTIPELLNWAADPWAFWYPSVNDYAFDEDFVIATNIAIPVLDRQYRSRWL